MKRSAIWASRPATFWSRLWALATFFGLLPEQMQGSKLYGVELDSITGRIAKQLYPKADITIAGFETTDRKRLLSTSPWATSRSDNIR